MLLSELIYTGKTAKSLHHLQIPFSSLLVWLFTFSLCGPKQDAILNNGFAVDPLQPCLLPSVVSVDAGHWYARAFMQDGNNAAVAALTFLDVSNTFDPEVLGVRDVSPSRLFNTLFPLWHCPKLTTFVARDLGTGQLHTCI
jgi:hypothetical protein